MLKWFPPLYKISSKVTSQELLSEPSKQNLDLVSDNVLVIRMKNAKYLQFLCLPSFLLNSSFFVSFGPT